ncbi:alpha-amylase family glycosyl hydrolase [Bacillus spizizenii]|uniref:alpha-amylase family glycosyl hydrolase n=1 Tax=Bacillus spizizenii TaxID=96241 RepID=UPI000D9089E2|nr:alpha-amylase family glycosyl hydrolase [Bacillus spizizenii]SPU13020.1 alpha amylase [Bacillus spizizenii]
MQWCIKFIREASGQQWRWNWRLAGIISRLDYIKELGADVIWICPIYPSPNVDYGYDVTDHKTIMDSYRNDG